MLFYPAEEQSKIDEDGQYQRQQWMKGFFASECLLESGRIQMRQKLCFAETDGPFPENDELALNRALCSS